MASGSSLLAALMVIVSATAAPVAIGGADRAGGDVRPAARSGDETPANHWCPSLNATHDVTVFYPGEEQNVTFWAYDGYSVGFTWFNYRFDWMSSSKSTNISNVSAAKWTSSKVTVSGPPMSTKPGKHNVSWVVRGKAASDWWEQDCDWTVRKTHSVELRPPLNASLSPDLPTAPEGTDVTFTLAVQGGTPPYTASWQYGDGASGTSSGASPHVRVHPYGSVGTKTVTVSISDKLGRPASASTTVTVTPRTSLNVSADGSPKSGDAPLQVAFTCDANGGAGGYSFEWVFGDGNTSTKQNPDHTYYKPRTYVAICRVRDTGGAQVSASVPDIVVTAKPLIASAVATPKSGEAPLTVAFTCGATGGVDPYKFSWTFGDGNASADKDAAHRYEQPGSYVAICRVTDLNGEQASASVPDIAALPKPLVAAADAAPKSGTAPLKVGFTCSGRGGMPPYSYAWDFDDGTPVDLRKDPTHTYNGSGKYAPTCTVTDSMGKNASKGLSVDVGAGGIGGTFGTLGPVAVIGVTAALAIAIGLIAWGRRRRRREESEEPLGGSESHEPGPDEALVDDESASAREREAASPVPAPAPTATFVDQPPAGPRRTPSYRGVIPQPRPSPPPTEAPPESPPVERGEDDGRALRQRLRGGRAAPAAPPAPAEKPNVDVSKPAFFSVRDGGIVREDERMKRPEKKEGK